MSLVSGLNVREQCAKYRVSLWACPQFLFIVMGIITVIAIVATATLAERYAGDPMITIAGATVVAVLFLIIGHTVVLSFDRLALAARSQAEFVSVISHQLRTPLSAVRWQLDVMAERIRKGNTDISSVLGTVQDENNRVIKLVSALLEVNRIEEKRMGIHIERVALWDLVSKTVEYYRTFAGALRLEIRLERAEEHAYWVSADEGKLRWIIENLIDNAVRYSDKGGRITIRIAREKKYVKFSIEDQGIGIPKENQKDLFKKFYRAPNAQQVQTEGSGLGLFIVKSFVEILGGSMHYESEEGVGTTFWFFLPSAEE